MLYQTKSVHLLSFKYDREEASMVFFFPLIIRNKLSLWNYVKKMDFFKYTHVLHPHRIMFLIVGNLKYSDSPTI